MKRFIGLDVSKKTFTVAFPLEEDYQVAEFTNDVAGIDTLMPLLNKQEDHLIMEATGHYSGLLAYTLCHEGYQVSVINPKQASYFAKMQLSITKTDVQDAKMLSCYGQLIKPELFKPHSDVLLKIQHKRVVIRQLKKQQHALECIGKEQPWRYCSDEQAEQVSKEALQFIKDKIKELEKSLCQLAQREFSTLIELLVSVKGIGKSISTALITATGGFQLFDTPKQFAKFLGIAPCHHQSGTSVKWNRGMNRGGDPHLRALLFMGSWSAIRYNSSCKALYQRLRAAGKPGYVALIAVCNKLIRQIFAVVKSSKKYIDNYEEKQSPSNKKIQNNLAF
ncbi:IS110 family RNA-guided transposase [Catalinimonas niigatensis]|uniref:IS110 family transposase n=1 Tax=Catalinimonas niigatensis TaxID=1397264 RepID=UPI0026653433|nr:IS110 family transposase [Catalinimonas niigatensis]WPP49249.1 IS110 family transposase [Catalinimonas niigatensis]WPP53427.1 IS110 family transposase [Catalinimonas niigatensis]